jgi:hypothetical protein
VNDLTPPRLKLLTATVAAGRPTLAVRATDTGSGVDPLSLAIGYKRILLGAAVYDPLAGIALYPMPVQAPKLTATKTPATLVAYDFQETKNVNTVGSNPMPNTTFKNVTIHVVHAPTLAWLVPNANECVKGTTRLAVVGSATKKLRSVTFFDGKRRIGTDRTSTFGLFSADWNTGKAARGKHVVRAVLTAGGQRAAATRTIRVCR